METYLSFWVRKNLQSLSRKRFSSLHLFDIENNLLSEHKFNELMKKSHTVLSVTTRNIPGREIPDPHPIVMPSKMATCINAHKIFIQVLNEEAFKVKKNTKKVIKNKKYRHSCDLILSFLKIAFMREK